MNGSKDYGLPSREWLGLLQRGPENRDYLLTTNFTMKIVRCPILSYFIQSVSIADADAKPVVAPGMIGPPLMTPTAKGSLSEFTVKYTVNEDLSNYAEVVAWMRECAPYKDFREVKPMNEVLSEAFVVVTSNRKNPLIKIGFHNIFPVEVAGFEFKNTDTENPPIIATARFAIGNMAVEEL